MWGLTLVALGAVLLTLRVGQVTQPLQALFAEELAEDPHDLLGILLIHLVPVVSPRTELLLGVGALAYAALEGLEVWGLWRDLLWGESLVVVGTAAFLPYEVWELSRHLTVFKVLSLGINVSGRPLPTQAGSAAAARGGGRRRRTPKTRSGCRRRGVQTMMLAC